jgi:FkbM family methyltransferase
MSLEMYTIEAHGRSYRIQADGIVAQCAREGNPYEPRLLERIRSQVGSQPDGGFAIDVGAHIGNHTLWMAEMCSLRVAAFEPSHEAFPILWRNANLYNGFDGRVVCQNVALGSKEANGRLVKTGQYVEQPWESMTNEVELGDGDVAVYPLDMYGYQNVSVIKIDVEGMEPQVIRGARETIFRNQPLVYTETWGPEASEMLRKELEPLGYELVKTIRTATPVEEWAPA